MFTGLKSCIYEGIFFNFLGYETFLSCLYSHRNNSRKNLTFQNAELNFLWSFILWDILNVFSKVFCLFYGKHLLLLGFAALYHRFVSLSNFMLLHGNS